MPFLRCHFPSNTKYKCFKPLCQECSTSPRPTATFLIVSPQRATSYTWTSPLLFLTHIPLLSQIYCKYHTPAWQGQNFTSHLLLCILFSGTSGNYVRAAWNRAKSHMRLASHGLVTTALCYRLMVNSMKTSFAQQRIVATPLGNHMN